MANSHDTPRVYSIIFTIFFTIFFNFLILLHKLYSVYKRIVRSVYLTNYQSNKIEQQLQNLQKIPKQIILNIQVKKSDNKQYIIGALLEQIEIIKMIKIQELVLYFWGIEQKDIQVFQAMLQDTDCKQKFNNFKIARFDNFYYNLTKQSLDWDKKQVPLIISMSSYPTLNCIPFNYLIDAQFSFCPYVSDCIPTDIQKCFQQYSNSKQRHGK